MDRSILSRMLDINILKSKSPTYVDAEWYRAYLNSINSLSAWNNVFKRVEALKKPKNSEGYNPQVNSIINTVLRIMEEELRRNVK